MEEMFYGRSLLIHMTYGNDKHIISIDECEDVEISSNEVKLYTTIGNFVFVGTPELTGADDYQIIIKTADGEILISNED